MKTNIDIDLAPFQGKKILCAVSGGMDSMCLLNLLHSNGLSVTAAHFEHGIRGEESERDMDFVKDFCKARSIPFVCERANVPQYAAENGMSVEQAARELRYAFLERERAALGCDYIATAHNLEDNAETLLFNISRGSGARGLSGIPRRRGHIVRPLLSVSRRDIEGYMRENAIPHVEDSTNATDDYTRNLIRHRLMPLLRGINPGFDRAAMRTAELMGRDEDCLSALAEKFLKEHLQDNSIACAALGAEHVAIVSRALRQLLPGLHMEHVDTLLDFAAQPGFGRLSLPGHSLLRDSGRLYFDREEPAPLPDRRLIIGESLPLPEAGLRVSAEIVDYNGEVNDLFKTSYLKYEIMSSDICVTSRREGDALRPLGRGCTKKLKALFVERSYPAHKRDICPVLRDEQGILLVYGIAVDERAKAVIGEKALKICFEEIETDA